MSTQQYKTDIWMKLPIGDFYKTKSGMTAEQVGAWICLTVHHYVHGPIDDDDAALAIISHVAPERFKAIKASVLRGYDLRDGRWVNDIITALRDEADNYKSRVSEANRQKANELWRKDREEKAELEDRRKVEEAAYNSPQPNAPSTPSPGKSST